MKFFLDLHPSYPQDTMAKGPRRFDNVLEKSKSVTTVNISQMSTEYSWVKGAVFCIYLHMTLTRSWSFDQDRAYFTGNCVVPSATHFYLWRWTSVHPAKLVISAVAVHRNTVVLNCV